MLLNELGFDEGLITPLRECYLGPIASLLYPDCGGGCLDSHKAFVVKYDLKEDLDLSYHYDNAEVTLNVSLGKDFTGGNLYFGDMKDVRLMAAESCVDVCVLCCYTTKSWFMLEQQSPLTGRIHVDRESSLELFL